MSIMVPDETKLDTSQEIIAQWQDMSIEDYGPDKFARSFVFTNARQISNDGFAIFDNDAAHHRVRRNQSLA